MEKTILQESQLYTRALYPRRRGCPLWVPEPNEDLPAEYHEIGVQMGDVGVLTDDGGFDFVFNACRSSSDPINQGGVPDGFQPLTIGRTFSTHTHSHFFPPDHLVLSAGAKRRALDIEAMAHPLPGIPVGAGAGFSINFAKDQGAAIYLPNGANSVDARNQRVFCEYAKRNAESWYRFMYETLGMDVENGDIYFITGFDKTDCWENTVYANSMKEQKYEILFSTGGFTGADGCFRLSSSSLYGTFSRRRSPLHNSNHNQALFIRGFRVSIARGIRSFLGGSAVEVTNTNKSSMSGVFGKKGPYPFGRGRSYTSSSESSSSPGPHGSSEGSSLAWSLSGNGNDSDTSMEEDDIIESSKLYHPSRILNNYLIRSTIGDDVSVVITHDEDWVALLTEEDLEMPDDSTLIERAESLFRITVNNGCASLNPTPPVILPPPPVTPQASEAPPPLFPARPSGYSKKRQAGAPKYAINSTTATYESLDFDEILDENVLRTKSIVINRAPLMSAWATVVAERMGFQREEALSIASVYTEMNAKSKGVTVGVYSAGTEKNLEATKGGAQPYVEFIGRRIPLHQKQNSKEQYRAVVNGTPTAPTKAFGYISQSFRENTSSVVGALRLLANSYSSQEISDKAWSLYVDFRPEVKGWGKQAEVKCSKILDLRKPPSTDAESTNESDNMEEPELSAAREGGKRRKNTLTAEDYGMMVDEDQEPTLKSNIQPIATESDIDVADLEDTVKKLGASTSEDKATNGRQVSNALEALESYLKPDKNDMDTSLTFKALDPNDTPKRPLNAFMIFARDRRPQVTSENPFIRTGEISKILSREWNSKPPHDKRLYEVQARQMKDKFVTRYPDYVYRRRPNNSRKRRRTDHTIVIDHSHDIASQDQSSSFVDPADVSIQGADLGEGPSRSQGSGGGQGIGNFDGPG